MFLKWTNHQHDNKMIGFLNNGVISYNPFGSGPFLTCLVSWMFHFSTDWVSLTQNVCGQKGFRFYMIPAFRNILTLPNEISRERNPSLNMKLSYVSPYTHSLKVILHNIFNVPLLGFIKAITRAWVSDFTIMEYSKNFGFWSIFPGIMIIYQSSGHIADWINQISVSIVSLNSKPREETEGLFLFCVFILQGRKQIANQIRESASRTYNNTIQHILDSNLCPCLTFYDIKYLWNENMDIFLHI